MSDFQNVTLTSFIPKGFLDREHLLCYSKRSPVMSYAPPAVCSLPLLTVPQGESAHISPPTVRVSDQHLAFLKQH